MESTTKKTYALGAVKPHVETAANVIGNKFGVNTIYGVGIRSGPSDHPRGLALDFMVGSNKAQGDAIASFVIANWDALGVEYIIWQQRIKNSSAGPWEQMEDRGSVTANHGDHPHVSFKPSPGTGSLKISSDGLSPFGSPSLGWDTALDSELIEIPGLKEIRMMYDVVAFIVNPSNWWRVFLFLFGGVLIVIVLWRVVNASPVAKSAAQSIIRKKV